MFKNLLDCLMCFTVYLLIALALIPAKYALAAPIVNDKKHVVVIDAGSSGTRLYFYTVMPDGNISIVLSNFEFKDEDGIDNFVCDPLLPRSNVMKVVITPLLTRLKEVAKAMNPPVAIKSIEVNLLATAGMRSRQILCESQYPGKGAQKVAALYKIIRKGISSNGFKVGEVRTSDGNKEEGPWTWLNLNYVLQKLDLPYGDLEVGGSSTQIVFPVDPLTNPVNDANNIFSISYKGKKYTIFSKSYLGLGQDDARKWLRNSSVAAPERCWATGFDKALDVGEKETTYNKLARNGLFDYTACSGYYRQYIEEKIAEQGGSPQAGRSLGDFVGLDGTWYAYEYFLTPPADFPSQLTTAIPSLCANSSSFESISTKKDVQFQCPNGTYVATLMFDSRGLFNGSQRSVTLSRSNDRMVVVGDKNVVEREITWTRGYLLQRYFAN